MASLFFRMQNKMCATNPTLKTWSHWNMWSTPCFLTEHVKTSKEKMVSSQNLLLKTVTPWPWPDYCGLELIASSSTIDLLQTSEWSKMLHCFFMCALQKINISVPMMSPPTHISWRLLNVLQNLYINISYTYICYTCYLLYILKASSPFSPHDKSLYTCRCIIFFV